MNEATSPKLLANIDDAGAPGVVWAFRGFPGEAPESLPADGIEAAIASRRGWVWLHLDLLDRRSHGWVAGACALPAASHAILECHDPGYMLDHEAGVVHGVFAELHGELQRSSDTIGLLHFVVRDGLLVTGRRHTLASVQAVREALLDGRLRPDTAFELFEAIVSAFGDNATRRLGETARQLDDVEDQIVTERLSDERRRLKQARRLAVSLHRPVAALSMLLRDQDRTGWELTEAAHLVLGRLAAIFERLDAEVLAVNDRAKLLQDELSAELADESNRSLRALAIISALLLPGTLVTGIFGMNTGGLPFTETPYGFEIAILIGVAGTTLFHRLLKRAGVSFRF